MKDFADKIGLMVLFLILFLPFLGSLCAAFLPSNARNAEAWLAGSVALAVTAWLPACIRRWPVPGWCTWN